MTDTPSAQPAKPQSQMAGTGGAMSPPGLSWALFEFARNPYFMIVVTYVFPAYFAQWIIGDPVAGQAAVAEATKWAGIIGAITAPLLGAMMDRGGSRKPMMAVFVAMLAVSGFGLWWSISSAVPSPADPNISVFYPPSTGLGVTGTMCFLVLGFVGYTYSELMHNAMLRQSGRPESLSQISGAGIGLGQLATAVVLAGVVVIALTSGALGGAQGEFALQRGTGPFVAIWLIVFVVPFFIYVPDGAPVGGSWVRAAKEVLAKDGKFDPIGKIAGIVAYLRGLFKEYPEAAKYLLACLIFKDGITALLAIGGVYSAGVLGWGVAEGGLYGIWASIFGAIGGLWLAPTLDRALGSRLAIMTQLALLCVAFLIALGTTKASILYGLIPAGQVVHGLGLFDTLADVFYLGIIAFVAALAAANIAASRHMMVLLAPKDRLSEFFGLFALSSTATVWIGPMLIEVFTNISKDQRIGFSPVLLLLGVGLALMFALKKTTGAKGQVEFSEAVPH